MSFLNLSLMKILIIEIKIKCLQQNQLYILNVLQKNDQYLIKDFCIT